MQEGACSAEREDREWMALIGLSYRAASAPREVDVFDAHAFGITPEEAGALGPWRRLMLELSWEALEDAGIAPRSLRGTRTGVFASVSSADAAGPSFQTDSGSAGGLVARCVSGCLGFAGPSLVMDQALHEACRSMRGGTSTLALVEAVPLNPAHPRHGAGVVVLKPLPRALADGDSIYCVVREGQGSADGAVGISELIERALTLRGKRRPRGRLPERPGVVVQEHRPSSCPVSWPVRREAGRSPPKVAFVFAGAGSAWWGMARDLMGTEPVFRASFEACDAAFQPLGGWSLVDALFAPMAGSKLDRGAVQLPVVLGVQVSLAALWRDWGIEPSAVMGFSAGEWAAAHVAGILSLEESFALTHHFLEVMREAFGGVAMAVVGLPAADVEQGLAPYAGRVAIASENSPRSTGIGGEPAALQELTSRWLAEGVFARRVDIDVAGHLPPFEPFLARHLRECPELKPLPGRVLMMSTVTGAVADGASMGPSYWTDHIRKRVRFSSAVKALLESGHELFLDVNPHPIHARSVEENFMGRSDTAKVLASLQRGEASHATLHRALTALAERGCEVREERVRPRADTPATHEGPAELFVLSARTEPALREQARRTAEHLREQSRAALSDLCFTASQRRDHHEHRLALVAHSRSALAEGLEDFGRRGTPKLPWAQGVVRLGVSPRIGFVFSGLEGFPFRECARALMDEPRFREHFERCEQSVRALIGESLIQAVQSEQVRAEVELPLLFAFQVSLAALWSAWGIRPDAVVGHGVGEVSAAHLAGALSLDDALALLVGRTRDPAPQALLLPLYSSVRGGRLSALDLDSAHWRESLWRQRALFEPVIQAMLAEGVRGFVELAPDPVLSRMLSRTLEASSLPGTTALCSLRRDQPPRPTLLEALGTLHTMGREPMWKGLFPKGGHMTELPTYAWQRERLGSHADASSSTPVKGARVKPGGAEPIAVVGMSCRFPGGVRSPEDFWRLLAGGVNAVREVPSDRWDLDAWYDADPEAPGKMYSRHGGFLDDVDAFDASFFGISKAEARSMDPQQRMLLELSWEALESAGVAVERLQGTATGVFVGLCLSDYALLELNARDPRGINAYSGSGSVHSIAAGRIAYALGLEGPAVAVDTACSSSLVAAHLACQSLREGECDVALVGGASLLLSPRMSVYFSKLRVLSTDGACRAFDSAASGYVRGEGAGVVVLKRLSDALAEGAPILGVLRGSAVSQGGRSNGLTAPSGPSQERVIQRALRQGGVAPLDVGYVEAHGTGTSLGDSIEVEALTSVLAPGRPRSSPLRIGSVKTNLGHLEGAAGIASLLKVLLALRHRELPRSLHFETPSPYIPWAELPIEVVTEHQAWPAPEGGSRVAGVSSFGFSGTNAHLVVEEAPARPPRTEVPPEGPELLVLSARDPEALRESAERLHALLVDEGEGRAASLRDVCYSASCRRSHHEHRLAVVARSKQEAAVALEAFRRGVTPPSARAGFASRGGAPGVVFLFSGDEELWSDSASEALSEAPGLQDLLLSVDAVLNRLAGGPVIEKLRKDPGAFSASRVERLARFSLQLSLVARLRACGIEPDAVLGDGFGEVIAAHVAGVLSLEDAVHLLMAGVVGERVEVTAHLPTIPIYSSVTGARAVAGDFASDHWARHQDGRTRIESALAALEQDGLGTFVELSPAMLLAPVVQRCARHATVLPALREDASLRESLLSMLGGLFVAGVSPEWPRLFPEGGAWVPLPSYPWRKERYWVANPEPSLPLPEVVAGLVAAAPEAVRPAPPQALPPLHELVQLPAEQWRARVETFLQTEVALLLELPGGLPDARLPLVRFGFDSLMGMKLKARLSQSLGLTVSAVTLLSGLSLDGLVKLALESLAARPPSTEVAANDSMEEFRF
ncbi:polyketide synthase [Myxococcus stipitatus DSM 14675]|uniref:Polyketide synthase n=2 Tax=Myxococcus stipitatus TaxID=83455 RepID=L7UBI2_MYXSD|nr:polyketide synthase [Myxococcus stipitatus DSM 14675]